MALGVAYDGTSFHGFARQPGTRTVAGELAATLATLCSLEEAPKLVCAGRTDAGVHALGQVVHADLPATCAARFAPPLASPPPPPPPPPSALPGLARSLTSCLPSDVAVWRALAVPPGFDARFSATARRYRYQLDAGGLPDPLAARTTWLLDGPLDVAAMRLACDPLIGEHDFAAFCRRPPGQAEGPITRRVLDARLVPGARPGRLDVEIEARAFCHQMVRSVVGLLVAVGQGRARPSDVVARLASGARRGAPTIAPARGLCLVGVSYPEPFGSALTRA